METKFPNKPKHLRYKYFIEFYQIAIVFRVRTTYALLYSIHFSFCYNAAPHSAHYSSYHVIIFFVISLKLFNPLVSIWLWFQEVRRKSLMMVLSLQPFPYRWCQSPCMNQIICEETDRDMRGCLEQGTSFKMSRARHRIFR